MGSREAMDTTFDLTGRLIAVVGAGSGIGESVAEACAIRGATTACLDLDSREAERVAGSITSAGGRAEGEGLDVRDPEATRDAFESMARRHGRLDGVVCTPGLNVRKPVLDYTEEEFERVVAVNLKGSFNVLRSAGRLMRDAGSGSIVLFSSIRAQVVEPGQSVYAATKAGVVQLARTAAAELGATGVRVNALAPGVVETPLTEPIKNEPNWYRAYAEKTALGRWGHPEELAAPAVFLLSDASSYLTGTVLFVDGGWTAVDGRFQPPGMG